MGFVAYLSSNFKTTAGGIIIFDDVGRNYGAGYNETTGIFMAPMAGVYHIYFSILSEGGSATTLNLRLNGGPQRILSSYIAASQMYHTPNASVYVRLNMGDRVYLDADNSRAILDSNRYSSFGSQLITH